MTPWLHVIGIGEDGLDMLPSSARGLIEAATLIVGGERHLAMLPETDAARLTWRIPLLDTMEDIANQRGKPTVVLATGDPMCFGIGVTLARHFEADEIRLIPAPSAFALACARLGWARDAVDCLTLHGRPLETIRSFLAPGQKLLILSHDGETPAKVAAMLDDVGFGPSKIHVLEHMGGDKEKRLDARADTWSADRVADLNTIAIDCRTAPRTKQFYGTPGLPDRAFEHDGQLTKREVRAITLSSLGPAPGALLWDVGAGAGSVAIEWLLTDRRTSAIAIERKAERVAAIARNALALGVPRLGVQQGSAPEALELLERPDAVFIGGGLTIPGLVETCWARLKPSGRLVANAVTLEGEAQLARWQKETGGTMVRIAIQRARPVGEFMGWRAQMPVTQLAAIKP